MAANFAILTTLTALLLFSGCIDGSKATTDLNQHPPAADEATEQPVAKTAGKVEPKCSSNISNYGTAITLGKTYVFSGRGGNFMVVYEESNGIRGLQTEEECTTPDTKIAEIPQPFGLNG